MKIQDFYSLMKKRHKWKKNRCKTWKRADRNGAIVEFNLTLNQFIEIFLPYKDDYRLYLKSSHSDRLTLCRYEDLGSYTIGNIYIDTNYNNIQLALHSKYAQINRLKTMRMKYPNGTFFGKKHTKEARQKIKDLHYKNKYQQGKNNSQYGTCWIYNLESEENKKINKDELDSWLEKGWANGRIQNFIKYKNKIKNKIKLKSEKLKIIGQKNDRIINKKIEEYEYSIKLYNLFVDGNYKSINEFWKTGIYNKSRISLIHLFNRNIPHLYEEIKGKKFAPFA